jgi:hypothetical protein
MWVIGGLTISNDTIYNDIWWSNDGIYWEQAISMNTFSPREGHTSIIYNNKAWVICGAGNIIENDVWYSPLSYVTSLPPQISNIDPVTYTTNTLEIGNTVYGDRGYVFINPITSDLLNQIYIETLNNDKDVTTFSLTFTVGQAVQVFVALDANITTPPQWLQGWTKLNDLLTTTDAVPGRILYEKKFNPGIIILGPNHDPGLFLGRSMYSVIVLPIINQAKDWELYN